MKNVFTGGAVTITVLQLFTIKMLAQWERG